MPYTQPLTATLAHPWATPWLCCITTREVGWELGVKFEPFGVATGTCIYDVLFSV